MKRLVSLMLMFLIVLPTFAVLTPKARAISGPVISSVSAITATRLQTIHIYGSDFGNTWPQTVSLGDGSVDTLSSATPYMCVSDNGKYKRTGDPSDGGDNWAAGIISPGCYAMVGIILLSWSDNEIVLGGFGTALGVGQGTWYIANGDPITVTVVTSSGQATYTVVVGAPLPTQSSTSIVCSPNPSSSGSSVTCKATVSGSNPTGTVTWSTSSSTGSFSQSASTLSSGSCSTTYTDTGEGSVTITASYSGDSNNAPSSGSTTLTCLRSRPAEFNMHWASQYYGVTAGEQTSFVIYLDYTPGFSGLVNLSFQGLPTGCVGQFDIAGAQAPTVPYRTLFVTTPSNLNNGTYTFTVKGESGDVSQTIPVTLTVGTGEITGVIYRDDNGNGIRDPGEPAVSGATIGYYATQNYMNLYQTGVTSDSNGKFTLANVPFNVDNEVDVSATGLEMRNIKINIMNQVETHLDIGMSTPPASGWKACTQFSITASSVSFSQYLLPCVKAYNLLHPFNQISIDSINSLPPENLYIITRSSSANQAEFTQALSQFLHITVPKGYDPVGVCVFEIPFLQVINALFSANLHGPITISIPTNPAVPCPLDNPYLKTTSSGYFVLALTFSECVSLNKVVIEMLQTIVDSLFSIVKAVTTGRAAGLIQDAIELAKEKIETIGDLSVNIITSDLTQIGSLDSYTLLDLLHAIDAFSTLSGIVLKLVDMITSGGTALASGGSHIGAVVGTALSVLDIAVEEVSVFAPSWKDNPLYQLLETGIGLVAKFHDPNGTTIIPSVFDTTGTLVLGYNFSSGDIIYANPEGILIPTAEDWLVLLNESASNPVNYTVCLTAIGGSAAVPYNLQIISYNQNVTAIGYSGMVLGGTSTIIPISVSTDGNLTRQVYVKPTVSVSETGNVYDFVATGLLSNGSLATVTKAFLIINGSQFAMAQENSSTFEIQTPVNLPGNVSYFVYMISPNVPGGFASGVLIQYNVTFDQTGVGSDFTGTVVAIDGSNYDISTLPASFWWYNGSTHTFAFQSPLVVGSGAKQYDWMSTTGLSSSQSSSITVTDPGSVTGNYVTGNYVTRVHDVAVTNVLTNRTWVYQGWSVNINVTAKNNGDFDETVAVTLYYNITGGGVAGTQTLSLLMGENKTITFTWNTTGVETRYGGYTITAVADISPLVDSNSTNNVLQSPTKVVVRILGDMNGDGKVDIYDAITFANYFGSQKGDARWNADADINRDGKTDIYDAIVIAEHFGISSP